MTAKYMYSRTNADNLPLPVKMQLSSKLKTFSDIFIASFDFAWNFEHFEKETKISLIVHIVVELLTPKDVLP